MPNWCHNQVAIISNNKKQLKKIDKLLTDTTDKNYFFNKFYKQINYPLLFMVDFINIIINVKEYSDILEEELTKHYISKKEFFEVIYEDIRNSDTEKYELESIITEIYSDKDRRFFKILEVEGFRLIIKEIIKKFIKAKNNNKDEYYYTKKLMTDRIIPKNPFSTIRPSYITDLATKNDSDTDVADEIDKWYSFNCNTIGCKWNPDLLYDGEIINFKDSFALIYDLDTPWCPCINFCKILTEIFDVEIDIRYDECGEMFAGYSYIVDGQIEDEFELTFDSSFEFELFTNSSLDFYTLENKPNINKKLDLDDLASILQDSDTYILENEIEDYCFENDKDGDNLIDKILNKIEEGLNEALKDDETYEFFKETLEKSSNLFKKNIIKKLEKKRKKLLKKKHVIYIKHKKGEEKK